MGAALERFPRLCKYGKLHAETLKVSRKLYFKSKEMIRLWLLFKLREWY
jgi:hypothetical protein